MILILCHWPVSVRHMNLIGPARKLAPSFLLRVCQSTWRPVLEQQSLVSLRNAGFCAVGEAEEVVIAPSAVQVNHFKFTIAHSLLILGLALCHGGLLEFLRLSVVSE